MNVTGELCISGDGLARGYKNKSDLNFEKFVANPFDDKKSGFGKRMYRTGDIAKWNANGCLEILGRKDHQLKIRGYRIEPSEIEQVILKYEAVKEVIVIDHEEKNGIKYLCAYLVITQNCYTEQGLREYLKKLLPEYMIPSYFIILKKIPLMPNGKVDRKGLPLPKDIIDRGSKYVEPRNETEKQLIKLWEEVLNIEKIGIDDDFFRLGGHSLKATILVSKMEKKLNIQLPLSVLFKSPNVRQLAAYIHDQKKYIHEVIPKADIRKYYPISASLEAIVKESVDKKLKNIYNKTEVLIIEGDLNKNQLERAFTELIKRHEILRTSFEIINGQPVQMIHDIEKFHIDYIKAEESMLNDVIKNFIRPFYLDKPPLIRIMLIELNDRKYALLFDMHQIISDGTSTNILIKEIMKLYSRQKLPSIQLQFKDYSVWLEKYHKSDEIKNQKDYWLKKLSGNISLVNIHTDYQRSIVPDYAADKRTFILNKELTYNLNKLANEFDSTLYMVLLSAYNMLLYSLTGKEDIVVGTPVAARRNAELQDMMGLFVNNIAMRNHPNKDKTYAEFLLEVKKNALDAYENQDYQFEKLVEELQIPKQSNKNALFDTMFALHNMQNYEYQIDGLKITPYEIDTPAIKYDLVFHINEIIDVTNIELRYRTSLFKKDTINKIVEQYLMLLQEIVKNPEREIGSILKNVLLIGGEYEN
jgi:tyrocidine synthetase-3